jgi:hypothetical protein
MKSSSRPMLWSLAIINGLAATISATDASTITGKLGNAQQISNNPQGAVYIAELPTHQGIRGSLVATSASVLGTSFTVNFANLPSEGGPFRKFTDECASMLTTLVYHIHQEPVPTNGSCAGTGGHLDPYQRGESPACVMSSPETCQVGDLAGKHGSIPGTSFSVT